MVVSEQSDREEIKYVKKALIANGCMKWSSHILIKKEKAVDPSKDSSTSVKIPVSMTYVSRGQNTDPTTSPQTCNTLRPLLVSRKDKTQREKQCGV